MERKNRLDTIDRSILRILSLYEHLNLLQLWYEFGEDDALNECVTKEEISNRLEYLRAKGFLERVMEAEIDDHSGYLSYRIRTGADDLDSWP
ncbi:MAG: hypothetical protein ACFFCW_32400 [Candidatus Hodarchaeota archaeon]